LIRKSLIYSILTAFLTCLYTLLIIVADTVFKGFHLSNSIYFPIFFFILIAFVFGPLKSNVQNFVDRIFFKGKYDYQKTIKHVSQMVVSVLDFDAIAKLLMDTVADTMIVDHCVLFLSGISGKKFVNFAARGKQMNSDQPLTWNENSALVRWMQTHRQPVMKDSLKKQTLKAMSPDVLSDMEALNAEIALPLIFEETLNGFIVLGEKRSGDLFIQEDVDLLETLSSQSALAIENARSYKVIDDLNKHLEKKVEERTRALKEALFEKERTQEQLIRSESLAAIGQLVAGVAHELNNPLTSATSLVQSVIEDIEQWDTENPLDEDLIDDLKFVDQELVRARSIVSSLLGLSRQTQTYLESVGINSVVKDALRVMYNQYKHCDLKIVENYAPELPDIQGNFANLGQVVLNIIHNAIQAVVDIKGTVFLSTQFDTHANQVVFSCKDTGPGIPVSIRKDIFKPFFTTKAVGDGTGLGLYICHEIVRKHGGTLKLEDFDGPGALFEVRLPAAG